MRKLNEYLQISVNSQSCQVKNSIGAWLKDKTFYSTDEYLNIGEIRF